MRNDRIEEGQKTEGSAPSVDVRPSAFSNSALFWPILLAVVATDIATKFFAVRKLGGPLEKVPHEIFGEWFRFTLVYNPGAAFGLNVGDYSRWVFMALTIGALLILGRLYVSTRPGDSMRIISLALVCGGALGNLLDRIRSARGVVDFLDIGVGASRWPTFNVADMAVSTGAFLLAIVLWQEDRPTEESARIGLVSSELRHESGEAT
jgi:signal peptidase II